MKNFKKTIFVFVALIIILGICFILVNIDSNKKIVEKKRVSLKRLQMKKIKIT
ncbi:hypothetical protein GNF80_16170 [Clostridium perfringens]|nr:hypothetical protein [Clostridium perfringens]